MEAVPAKTEKTKASRKEDLVFFAPSVRENPDRLKIIKAFIGWRYGLTMTTSSIQNASVIVGKVDVETGAIVLPDTSLHDLKTVADEKLKIVADRPTIFAPLAEPFVRRQLEAMATVINDMAVELYLGNHAHAASILLRRQIERVLREAILTCIEYANYVVVDETAGALHIAVAALASIKGKYVVAVCHSPVMAAFTDYAVARREDIVAAVAAVIAYE